jgi:hypothetical protein
MIHTITHYAAIAGAIAAIAISGGALAYLIESLAEKAVNFIFGEPPKEGAAGAYEEPDRVRKQREAYVTRRMTPHEREFAEAREAAREKP